MTGRPTGPFGALVLDLVRRVGILEGRPDATAAVAAAEAQMSGAMASEAAARAEGDQAQAARTVHLTGTLVLPAGVAIAAGRTPRIVTVAGLKAGDRLAVTLGASLPAGLSLVDPIATKDGELTIGLLASTLIAASTSAVRVPLAVTVFR